MSLVSLPIIADNWWALKCLWIILKLSAMTSLHLFDDFVWNYQLLIWVQGCIVNFRIEYFKFGYMENSISRIPSIFHAEFKWYHISKTPYSELILGWKMMNFRVQNDVLLFSPTISVYYLHLISVEYQIVYICLHQLSSFFPAILPCSWDLITLSVEYIIVNWFWFIRLEIFHVHIQTYSTSKTTPAFTILWENMHSA